MLKALIENEKIKNTVDLLSQRRRVYKNNGRITDLVVMYYYYVINRGVGRPQRTKPNDNNNNMYV